MRDWTVLVPDHCLSIYVEKYTTRMVVQRQLVEPIARFSDLYEVFPYDKVRDTRQNQVF